MEAQTIAAMPVRAPWKTVGIAALLLLSALLFLYLFTARKARQMKGKLASLDDENQTLKGLVETANQSLADLRAAADREAVRLPKGYEMPLIRPGLMFNIQPVHNLLEPAFNAWNTGGTLRVFVQLDLSAPAWTFKLYSAGGALLKASNIPIEGAEPDGKRIATEIRSLLEESLDANSA
ncbi:MAG: hypothetical protein R3D58_06970 [Saprospiraceae bacterium]|nr:hypothetical protein [Lewinellaceae bacterium]